MTGGGGQCDKKKKTLGRVVMFSFLNNQLKRSIFYSLGCWDFIFLSRDSFFREEAKCGKKQEKCRGNFLRRQVTMVRMVGGVPIWPKNGPAMAQNGPDVAQKGPDVVREWERESGSWGVYRSTVTVVKGS